MPKIEKHSYIHEGTGTEITVDVWFGKMKDAEYNLRNLKVFFIKLEPDQAMHFETKYVYADTFAEVCALWEKTDSAYRNAITKWEKVIAVYSKSHMWRVYAKTFGVENPDSDLGPKYTGSPTVYPEALLSIAYMVGWKVLIGDRYYWSYHAKEDIPKLPYSYKMEPITNQHTWQAHRWSEMKFVPWTAERESWMSNLYEAFHRLIAGMRKFLDADENQIGDSMDNRQLLL